jgi:hypothetical protein
VQLKTEQHQALKSHSSSVALNLPIPAALDFPADLVHKTLEFNWVLFDFLDYYKARILAA